MSLPSGRSPHRAWIEVDHGALVHNLAGMRRMAGDGRSVIAVVKALDQPVTTWDASVQSGVKSRCRACWCDFTNAKLLILYP